MPNFMDLSGEVSSPYYHCESFLTDESSNLATKQNLSLLLGSRWPRWSRERQIRLLPSPNSSHCSTRSAQSGRFIERFSATPQDVEKAIPWRPNYSLLWKPIPCFWPEHSATCEGEVLLLFETWRYFSLDMIKFLITMPSLWRHSVAWRNWNL
jgi:hypothetical protein